MKHIYYSLKSFRLFFLFFTFTISSSDYYRPIDNTPKAKINFNQQPSPGSSFHCGLRTRYVPHHNYSTNTNTFIAENNTDLSIHSNIAALPEIYNAIKQRNNMLEQLLNNNPEAHTISFKKYFISGTLRQYLSSQNIDINIFESCEGTPLQHAIHHEFITLTDTTAHLLYEHNNSAEIKKLTTVIAHFASAGITFNHIGEVAKATALANAGWAILDCIQAAGEGIVEGLASVGHSIMHPIETVQNFTYAAINCGYYCGIALKEIVCVTDAIICGDFNVAHNKYTLWGEYCKNIAHALSEQCQELALRDVIKTLTRSAIECYATTRAINGFSNLFKHAHQGAALIAKKIRHGAQESTVLMSAEGIPVRIAQEIITQAKKLPRAQDKLLQVLSQFKSKKIKIGTHTFLLDKQGLKHILERHHPKYWKGKTKLKQSFFHKDITIPEIVKIIKQVIKQNRKLILKQGTNNFYKIDGVINGLKYIVGFDNGRIGQFYIPLKQ